MQRFLVDLFPLAFAGVCLWGLRPASGEDHTDYLARAQTDSIRGILAVAVVFVHLASTVRSGVVLPLFSHLGYLVVSVFFFLSGYTLQKQHLTHPDYSRGFLKKRLLGLLIPYIPAFFLYWLVNALTGLPASLLYVMVEFRCGSPIVTASWYIFCILGFYIAFWVLMRLFGQNKICMVLGTVVYSLLHWLVCVALDFGSWWYNTAGVLVLGVAWASWEQPLLGRIRKAFWPIFAGSLVLLAALTLGKVPLSEYLGMPSLAVFLTCLNGCVFCFCLLLFLRKLQPGNRVLRFLGSISLELYLYHNLFMTLLRCPRWELASDFAFVPAVLLLSVVFSWGTHLLHGKLLKAIAGKQKG